MGGGGGTHDGEELPPVVYEFPVCARWREEAWNEHHGGE